MKKNSFYSNYVSTHYQHVAPVTPSSFRKRYYVWKSYLSSLLPVEKASKILEIGCGVGHNLYSLKKLGYKNIFGTDYSQECVEICNKNGYDCQGVNEKTEKQFYVSKRSTYDLVILYDVLEHYTPEQGMDLLVSIHTMLKSGGKVLVSLPNANHPFSNSLFFADITHKFIYNEISLGQLFRNSRFEKIVFKQINSFTTYDDDFIKHTLKRYVLPLLAYLGELCLRMLAMSQGILLRQCKPTLIACAVK